MKQAKLSKTLYMFFSIAAMFLDLRNEFSENSVYMIANRNKDWN